MNFNGMWLTVVVQRKGFIPEHIQLKSIIKDWMKRYLLFKDICKYLTRRVIIDSMNIFVDFKLLLRDQPPEITIFIITLYTSPL
jgi:hypothetical protein